MSRARWRADTPGLPGLVHLNNADAGLIPASAAVIDMDRKGIATGWRVSPHYDNTEAEIDRLVDVAGAMLASA